MKRPLYFDTNATTAVDPRVLEAMMPFFSDRYGNPESSQHAYGWEAKAAVEKARAQVAALIGAQPAEITFTSGSTESLNLAILGLLEALPPGAHVIASVAEHKATLAACERAKRFGHEVTLLPVNRFGQVELMDVERALRPNTALVSLVHANNEIGSFNPIAEIAKYVRDHSLARLHVDAAQTAGKHPINVDELGADLLSLSGHKFYAPKGIGALYLRRSRVNLGAQMPGGGQERGLRGGTHNVPGIVGLGAAAEIARVDMATELPRVTQLRDHLINSVLRWNDSASDPGERRPERPVVHLSGHRDDRLCNNAHFRFEGIGSDDLLLGLHDIAFSTTSACSGGTASHVLSAIGVDLAAPLTSAARFGIGRFTTPEEVDHLIARLNQVLKNSHEKSKSYQGLSGRA